MPLLLHSLERETKWIDQIDRKAKFWCYVMQQSRQQAQKHLPLGQKLPKISAQEPSKLSWLYEANNNNRNEELCLHIVANRRYWINDCWDVILGNCMPPGYKAVWWYVLCWFQENITLKIRGITPAETRARSLIIHLQRVEGRWGELSSKLFSPITVFQLPAMWKLHIGSSIFSLEDSSTKTRCHCT